MHHLGFEWGEWGVEDRERSPVAILFLGMSSNEFVQEAGTVRSEKNERGMRMETSLN